MNALRRALYLQAAAWALAGIILAIAPGFVLRTVFGEPRAVVTASAWLRWLGVQSLGWAMLMTMVGHRVEELWWWSWAFALVSLGVTAVVVLNASLGLALSESRVAWWTFAVLMLAFTAHVLYGLFVSSREQPLP